MGARRRDRRVSVRRGALASAALAIWLSAAATAGPIAVIESGVDVALPEGYAVLDIRDEDRCFLGAPAHTRCLPAGQLLYADAGEPLGFHALRWVLGTLGLTGAEPLVIYRGDDGAPRDDALAAAALLHLNGQAEVMVHEGPALEVRDGARVRALWREVIYTAPIRTGEMMVLGAPAGTLRDRLKSYAEGGGRVAFAPGS